VFRTFDKASKYEIRGGGEVSEKYYHLSSINGATPTTNTVIDSGSVVFIDAGFIRSMVVQSPALL
jgi:hypothetical protein